MTAPRPPLADLLDLAPHPEGGWFRETWRSELELAALPGYPGPRAAGTAIYYLLGPGESSAWHQVRSAELWLWHRGGPLTLSLGGRGDAPGSPDDAVGHHILGGEVEAGEVPQLLVPPGVWQSARPTGDAEVLVSCVVVPGFDFTDFRMFRPGPTAG